jgi:hypothetical protein
MTAVCKIWKEDNGSVIMCYTWNCSIVALIIIHSPPIFVGGLIGLCHEVTLIKWSFRWLLY